MGLGHMGEPMVRSLAASGHRVVAWDESAERRDALSDVPGVEPGNDLAAAASQELLILMLPNGHVVREVLTGAGGAAANLPDGALVIDMSSSDPSVYAELAPALAERGIDLVDAPVSGNVSGAAAGTLTIMAGGDDAAIERARPLLDSMGKTIFHTGPLGSGQTMKALNNLLSAGGLMLAIEVLLVARRAGLDPAQVTKILNVSTGRNNSTERKIEPFVLSRAFDSGFGLSLMAKDVRTAAAIAARLEVPLGVGERVVAVADAAEAGLDRGADHTGVALWLESLAGVRLDGQSVTAAPDGRTD